MGSTTPPLTRHSRLSNGQTICSVGGCGTAASNDSTAQVPSQILHQLEWPVRCGLKDATYTAAPAPPVAVGAARAFRWMDGVAKSRAFSRSGDQ